MEIKNLQTILIGEGKLTKDVFLTLDLIPIQVVFRYDLETTECKFGKEGNAYVIGNPSIIDKIHTVDVYRELLNMVCETLSLEKRELYGLKGVLPKFDFKRDDYFLEYQYTGNFGYTYFTRTKLQHSLKYWDEWQFMMGKRDEYGNDLEDKYNIIHQYSHVLEHIKRQGVFTRRDYFEITSSTMDKFIRNLNRKKKTQQTPIIKQSGKS